MESRERWAQSYDRAPGDAIRIQSGIAANVVQALSIAFGQAGRALCWVIAIVTIASIVG